MPIQYHGFALVAQKYGGIDPGDVDAVWDFFMTLEEKCSLDEITEIVHALMSYEGSPLPPEFRKIIDRHIEQESRCTETTHEPSKEQTAQKRRRAKPGEGM